MGTADLPLPGRLQEAKKQPRVENEKPGCEIVEALLKLQGPTNEQRQSLIVREVVIPQP